MVVLKMEEEILSLLKVNRNQALSGSFLFSKLSDSSITYEEFSHCLKKLQEQKKVYCSGKDRYILNPFVEGIFHIKRNKNCVVVTPDYEIMIDAHRTFGCMDGDRVLVRIVDFNTFTGTIKEIVERKGIIAEVKTIHRKKYGIVGEDKYLLKGASHLVDHMIVGIKPEKTKSGRFYQATIDRVIGHKNAPHIKEQEILYDYGIPVDFSKAALKELDLIPDQVLEEDFHNRRDLRDQEIFTIDGDDTKDIDDAISIRILPNGHYLLGVHIADVTHYVKSGSQLDLEARERGTSYYMPGVVNPMYPAFLSNGICSLNPDVDRLAVSCEMEINEQGKIVHSDIFRSVIHSRIQMTYKKVNRILDENIVSDGYHPYVSSLRLMKKLAHLLKRHRVSCGMLDFDSDEIKFVVDEQGKVLELQKRGEGTGEELIEEFMLACNEAVATYIVSMGVPCILRLHDVPNFELLSQVLHTIHSYGVELPNNISTKDPKVIQNILEQLHSSSLFPIFSKMILRCMAKAYYGTTNIGHFGIGISAVRNEAYAHFTSPIRRYPDTMVHRILDGILDGNLEVLYSENYALFLEEIAKSSSEAELVADQVEREANKMKMAEYLKPMVGTVFSGKIISFTDHGMFVELSNFAEGRVGFEDMDDFYVYHRELEIVVGERTKKIYRLGDKVQVMLTASNPDTRMIDLKLHKGSVKNERNFQS